MQIEKIQKRRKITWRMKEGLAYNIHASREEENKINAVNAEHFCSNIETITLSPIITQNENQPFQSAVQKLDV